MKNYTETEINSLIDRFEAEKLPKVEWTHEAHLVVAIWYCRKYNLAKAIELVRKGITNHNVSVGTPNTDNEGYHESITRFWLVVANRFIETKKDAGIAELCNAFINSKYSKSNFPLNYYSSERLFSVDARYDWVEPDLKSFVTLEINNS